MARATASRAMWAYWCLVSIASALLGSCSALGADGSAVMYRSSYERIHDAQQKCPAGTTTSKPAGGDGRPDLAWSLPNELGFKQGDWNSSSPDDFLPYQSAFHDREPLRLVTLAISDVNDRDAPVKVSAVLSLARTASDSYSQFVVAEEGVQLQPGLSIMTVLMEGVYFETSKERGLCLVGCTRLADGKRSCDVFLELHFPWRLSLRSRRVRGTLQIGDAFKADITTQLGAYTNYVFQDGELVSSACTEQKRNALPPPSSALYRGNRFCATLMEIASEQWFTVWNPSGSSSPFRFDLKGGSYQMRILDIRCVDLGNGLGANVSAIFRAVPRSQDPGLAILRSGLGNGFAFAAEGVFNPSTGELCMVGCITEDLCNASISIFISLTFSLTQRSSLVGIINSASKFGLADKYNSFQSLPKELEFEYSYSKLDSVKKKAMEDGAFDSGMRLSLLKYPVVKKLQGSLAQLSQDLSFFSNLIPRPAVRNYTALSLEMIAMEDSIITGGEVLNAADTSSSSLSSSSSQFVRVAARINLRLQETDEDIIHGVPAMSAEGLYIPKTGKAYMAACWPKQSSDQGITNSPSGEGLDCEVDLVIQYPPENVKWLVYPTVAVEISSKRRKDDPLYFSALKLETYPVLYGDQMKEIAFRKTIEAALSAMTLSLMILCVALQLLYVKRSKTAESVPYISLLMLGVQAFGYSIPLITGMEALFSRLTGSDSSPRYATRVSSIHEGELSVVLLYLVKLLSLGAFLLLLRLSQKVVKSRIRLSAKFPSEPRRVPSERKAAAVFFIVHLVGFSAILLFHYILLAADNVGSNESLPDSSQLWSVVWWKEMKEYVGLVQDLFLLPQVIAFSAWEKPIRGKPLRRSYYMGLTALRLLPHAYHALSKPWFNPYYAADYAVYANPKLDFYNRVGDILIPLLAIAMAGAVYAQQRWNALCLVKVARTGSSKLLRYGSKLYERLPSSSGPDRLGSFKNVEAELQPTSAAGEEAA